MYKYNVDLAFSYMCRRWLVSEFLVKAEFRLGNNLLQKTLNRLNVTARSE